jgi:serine/threonine-protein kinase
VVEVDVPNVTGLTRSDAEEALHAAGLVPVVQLKTLAADSADIGRVLAQDPDGGTAPAGSEVTITVGRKPLVVQQPNVTIGTVPVATIGP